MYFSFITLTFSDAVISVLCRHRIAWLQGSPRITLHAVVDAILPALMRSFLPFLLFNVTLERFHHSIAATEGLVRDRKLKGEQVGLSVSLKSHLAASDLTL